MPEDLLSSNRYDSQVPLPNGTGSLVLGIISLVLSLLFICLPYIEFIPLALGIVGLILANKDRKLYQATPELYTASSLNSSNAGRTCSIIGIILSALIFMAIVVIFIIAGTLSFSGIR